VQDKSQVYEQLVITEVSRDDCTMIDVDDAKMSKEILRWTDGKKTKYLFQEGGYHYDHRVQRVSRSSRPNYD
jgi:hypothetical protein